MSATVVATSDACSSFPSDLRCADGERGGAGSVAAMAWAAWLAVPVAATVLASLWAWWRARPERTPSAEQALRAHRDYLEALVAPARGTARAATTDGGNSSGR
jgi:hypothetical protein